MVPQWQQKGGSSCYNRQGRETQTQGGVRCPFHGLLPPEGHTSLGTSLLDSMRQENWSIHCILLGAMLMHTGGVLWKVLGRGDCTT
jgi:hypothetical protein